MHAHLMIVGEYEPIKWKAAGVGSEWDRGEYLGTMKTLRYEIVASTNLEKRSSIAASGVAV